MSIIDFPLNPTTSTVYTFGSRSWLYNGRAWQSISTFVGYTGSQGAGFTGSQGDTGFVGSGGGFDSIQEITFYNTNTYTLATQDAGKLLALSSTGSTTINVLVPPDSSLDFEIGQRFDLLQYSQGAIAVDPLPGVSIYAPFGSFLNEQFSLASIIKLAANQWIFMGPQAAGYTGSAGLPGEAAAIGYTGSAGFGFTGSEGTGFTGSAGEAGFTGSAGLPGEAAAIGYTGSSSPGVVNLYQTGNLILTDGVVRWYAPYDLNVESIIPRIVVAADQEIRIDIKVDNTTQQTLTIPIILKRMQNKTLKIQ
jgi:hypothetical protein